ncbi:unnamed protein product, partial [Meganyctiphanes norvegica]
ILALLCVVGGAFGDASLLHSPPHHGSAHHAPHHDASHHTIVLPTPHAVHLGLDHHDVGHHGIHHDDGHHGVHHGLGHHVAHHDDGHHGGAHHKSAGHHISRHAKPHHSGNHHEDTYHNSPADYGFNYAVHDEYSGAQYGHSETRDGYRVEGTYYVHLPDGRIQTVNYYADETGYHPTVTYEGTPTYHHDGIHHAKLHH